MDLQIGDNIHLILPLPPLYHITEMLPRNLYLLDLLTNLAEVDKVHEGVEVRRLDVLQHEYRVLPRPHRLEDGVEVIAARAQYHPVGLHRVALGRQGHVCEVLIVAEHPVG